MIKFICQYNYGVDGYALYQICEKCDSQLFAYDASKSHDIPKEGITVFNRTGLKVLYEWIENNRLLFAYKYIRANGVDLTGRNFECGFQIIGDSEDKASIDRIVCTIMEEPLSFETFFVNLFYTKDGLFFKGDIFFDYIDKVSSKSQNMLGPLGNIINAKSNGVILLMPKYAAFIKDKEVRMKVLGENMIPFESIKHATIIDPDLKSPNFNNATKSCNSVSNDTSILKKFGDSSVKHAKKAFAIIATATVGIFICKKKKK